MERFSHDLTLALEETSKCNAVKSKRWCARRRTRSTGNLPCAPLPTEDSSSSPTDPPIAAMNHFDGELEPNQIVSDSDDRQEFQFSLKGRQANLFPNFESDSLNENFSPARPNTRRKRKFKRMAVEYETTPSTPGTITNGSIFPIGGAVKKRVLKHTNQENFRANIFFCGKRKRSHRDRYMDYDHKQHSSSVPRQRDFFGSKSSYMEYRNRNNRSSQKPVDRILPLNKNIISKIEKISQDTKCHPFKFEFAVQNESQLLDTLVTPSCSSTSDQNKLPLNLETVQPVETVVSHQHRIPSKSGSFESTFPNYESDVGANAKKKSSSKRNRRSKKHKHRKNEYDSSKHQLQFDDPNLMDCSFNEIGSSSSISSSDSEDAETNDSDREGDDELTDWPGSEAMVNFTSKNDFKRMNRPKLKSTLPLIKSDEMCQEDDTLMSEEEALTINNSLTTLQGSFTNTIGGIYPPNSLNLQLKFSPAEPTSPRLITNIAPAKLNSSSMPIDITPTGSATGAFSSGANAFLRNQIESEMSGETSNILSSPNTYEAREIRAGCRRIRNERPGFLIRTSANEDFSKFLQNARQLELILKDVDSLESEKLLDLAKLYSLNITIENGIAILRKTSNTTQAVRIDQPNIRNRFLSDYKRRCYRDKFEPDGADCDVVQ